MNPIKIFSIIFVFLVVYLIGDAMTRSDGVYCKYEIFDTENNTRREFTSSVAIRKCEDRIYEATKQYWKVIGQTTQSEFERDIRDKVAKMQKWDK